MAISNISFLKPTSCTDVAQTVEIFCLPIRRICFTKPGGLLTMCDERWNCSDICSSDTQYNIPIVSGDLIQIQTLFYNFSGSNDDPAPYISWINATLCYGDNQSIDLASFTSRSMTAYGCDKPFQIIEIDTSLIPEEANCFFIQFENITDSGDTAFCCSQEFEILQEDCQADTVLLQGKRDSGSDCFGFCYGEPDSYSGDLIEYNNALRYYGYIKSGDGSVSFETLNDDINTNETILNEYILRINAMPPFAKDILLNQHLSTGTLCVNGEDYTFDNISLSNTHPSGFMKAYILEIYKECDNNLSC